MKKTEQSIPSTNGVSVSVIQPQQSVNCVWPMTC